MCACVWTYLLRLATIVVVVKVMRMDVNLQRSGRGRGQDLMDAWHDYYAVAALENHLMRVGTFSSLPLKLKECMHTSADTSTYAHVICI